MVSDRDRQTDTKRQTDREKQRKTDTERQTDKERQTDRERSLGGCATVLCLLVVVDAAERAGGVPRVQNVSRVPIEPG